MTSNTTHMLLVASSSLCQIRRKNKQTNKPEQTNKQKTKPETRTDLGS